QLIDARPAEEFAYTCLAKVAAARLSYGRSVLENRHRPELEDDKLLRVESGSPLLEYDWTAAIELDGNCGNLPKRRANNIGVIEPKTSRVRLTPLSKAVGS